MERLTAFNFVGVPVLVVKENLDIVFLNHSGRNLAKGFESLPTLRTLFEEAICSQFERVISTLQSEKEKTEESSESHFLKLDFQFPLHSVLLDTSAHISMMTPVEEYSTLFVITLAKLSYQERDIRALQALNHTNSRFFLVNDNGERQTIVGPGGSDQTSLEEYISKTPKNKQALENFLNTSDRVLVLQIQRRSPTPASANADSDSEEEIEQPASTKMKRSDSAPHDTYRLSLGISYPTNRKDKNNIELWSRVKISKVTDWITGNPSLLIQDEDISELKSKERELKYALKRTTAISDFISNLSHEIRTPLNGILGMLQSLSQTQLTSEQHLCIATATHSTNALCHLLSDVLDMSKVEAGKLAIHPAPVSIYKLSRLIEDLSQLFGNSAQSKGLSIFIDYPMEFYFKDDRRRKPPTPSSTESESDSDLTGGEFDSDDEESDEETEQYLAEYVNMKYKQKFAHKSEVKLETPISFSSGGTPSSFPSSQPPPLRKRKSVTGVSLVHSRTGSTPGGGGGGVDPAGRYRRKSLNDTKESLRKLFSSQSAPTFIISDIMRIRQVLVNLVSNAVKYTQKGSVTIRLVIRPDDEKYPIHIEVRDTGEGIREEDFKNVFRRFERIGGPENKDVDAVGRPEGTGIGLEIGKRITQSLGGNMTLETKRDQGSTFTLCLPKTISKKHSPSDPSTKQHSETNLHRAFSNRRNKSAPFIKGILTSPHVPNVVGPRASAELGPDSSIPKRSALISSLGGLSITVISRSGRKILGAMALNFIETHHQAKCMFYDNVAHFQNGAKKLSVSQESILGQNPLAGKAGATILLDTFSIYPYIPDEVPHTGMRKHSGLRTLTPEDSRWVTVIRQTIISLYECVFKFQSGGLTCPDPIPTTPQARHPVNQARLVLAVPFSHIGLLGHLYASKIPWYTGWMVSPVIPSRLLSLICKLEESGDAFLPVDCEGIHSKSGSSGPASPQTSPQTFVSSPSPTSAIKPLRETLSLPQLDLSAPPKYRILVVEDNRVNCAVFQSLMKRIRTDITIVWAYDGRRAVELFESSLQENEHFSMCFMDVNMPVMNGLDATVSIRSIESSGRYQLPNGKLTIVALTADSREESQDDCIAAGMNDSLSKPIILNALSDILCKYLPSS